MSIGRPTKYKPEYIKTARALAKLGATNAEMDAFFARPRTVMEFCAVWLYIHREDRNGVIAAQKIKRSERRQIKITSQARLRDATRARIWAALKGKSNGSLLGRLGYEVEDLARHLESGFLDGMTWENYGEWHVDHIKPCSLFDQHDPSQFAECWALSNLQPLWAIDNIKKGAKYG